jgi:16S rRNA (guanine1516-N2)-methyltransferase
MAPPKLCVAIDARDAQRADAASGCARELGLPLYKLDAVPADFGAALVVTDRRLELRVLRGDKALVGGRGVASELTAIDTTSGHGRSLGQPLLKAVGIKRRNPYRPAVLDATAGLGEDAWVLASVGCVVVAVERNPVTCALLADGLGRASLDAPGTAGRVSLKRADGVTALQEIAAGNADDRPDVVYLDPMFPPGRKTAERKAMRVLRLVSGDDADAGGLLAAALLAAARRVVVKRPLRADPLPGPAAAVCHKGKSLRFDVYPVR